MKILLLDIENYPHLSYSYDLWGNRYVPPSMLKKPGDILCFSAQWLGSDKVMFFSAYHHGKEKMIEQAHRLLDEADVVIHYNGRRHDIRHLNREIALAGYQAPSPYKQIDIYLIVKRLFAFPYSRLDYVCQALGLGAKVPHSGAELYLRCMEGDPKAWRLLAKYNKNDVVLLKKLFEYLKSWIPNLPNYAAEAGRDDVCTSCGSAQLEKRGFSYARQSMYQRYRCKDCGTFSQSTRAAQTVSIVRAS